MSSLGNEWCGQTNLSCFFGTKKRCALRALFLCLGSAAMWSLMYHLGIQSLFSWLFVTGPACFELHNQGFPASWGLADSLLWPKHWAQAHHCHGCGDFGHCDGVAGDIITRHTDHSPFRSLRLFINVCLRNVTAFFFYCPLHEPFPFIIFFFVPITAMSLGPNNVSRAT